MSTTRADDGADSTPRTDAVAEGDWAFRKHAAFEAMTDLARTLERELAARDSKLRAMEEQNERLVALITAALKWGAGSGWQTKAKEILGIQ